MSLHPSHPHYVAPVLEREAQSPGQHHGPGTSGEHHIKYFDYLLVLETLTPEERFRVGHGDFTQQEWDAWKARVPEPEPLRRHGPRRTLQREVKWDIRTGTDRRKT